MNMYNYLNMVSEQIRCKRARPIVIQELMNHITDQKADYMAGGMEGPEAEEAAVLEMGDPIEVGTKLDRIHRPKMEWKLLILVLTLSITGSILQIGIGIESQVLRHLTFTVLGIAVMFGICYLDYSWIARYAKGLWCAWMAAAFLYRMLGYTVNGGYPHSGFFAYLMIPVYAGIVYRYRDKGAAGIVKNVLFLLVPVSVVLLFPGTLPAVQLLAVGMLMLCLAIHKKWYGKKRWQMYGALAGVVLVLAAVGAIMLFRANRFPFSQESYVWHRLENMAQFRLSPVYEMTREKIPPIVETLRQGGTPTYNGFGGVMNDVRSGYLWLYLVQRIGIYGSVAISVILIAFCIYLFYVVLKQKNKLGHFMGIGCAVLLLSETILCLGMNLGYVPAFSLYLPFLSYGGANLIVSYVYVGLLLSIHRNSSIVKN